MRLLGAIIINKLEKLEEMYKSLEIHSLSRLIHEEIENLESNNHRSQIVTVVKNLSTDKNPGPDDLTGEFLKVILLKLFQKLYGREIFAAYFMRLGYPDTKPVKDTTKRKSKDQYP